MEKESLSSGFIRKIFDISPHLARLPLKRSWIDYDDEADVLYISFDRPQKATNSEMLDNGLLVRYRGKKIVGLTVLDASRQTGKKVKLSSGKVRSGKSNKRN